jgi:uncharacterized protein YkwD
VNKWIKKLHWHFIPSHENAFQPHALRMPAAAGILGLIVVVEALYLVGTFVILPSSNYFAAVFASVLVDQTNGVRQTESLGTLKTNPILEHAARLKVEDMVAKGYFSHNSPDGKTPWYWFDKAGYNYAAAGENLAVNFVDSQDVTNAWMQSPTHRANIMSGNYTEIGIAVMSGMYKGREAIFVVQEFGRPSVRAQETLVSNSEEHEPIIVLPPPTPNPSPVTKPVSPATTKKPVVTASQVTTTPAPARSTPTTTAVAGVETQKLPVSISSTLVPSEPEPIRVAETSESPSLNDRNSPIRVAEASEIAPSSIDTLVASPRQVTTTIYFILATLIALVLSLTVLIKIRVQHPHLVVNGILLIAITLSFVLLNSVIGFTGVI